MTAPTESEAKNNTPSRTVSRLGRVLGYALPALVVLLLYAQVRNHDFIDFDDRSYTTENPMVVRGLTWDGVVWAFSGSRVANYHPLTWLSHMLDYDLFGDSPGSFALVNAAIHACNAALVALLFVRLFGTRWIGIAAGIVFAAHPVLVEAVAWISQRKTVLATFFVLLSVLLYVRTNANVGCGKRNKALYVGSLVCFACSLLSKSMYVTLPIILVVLEGTSTSAWLPGVLRSGVRNLPEGTWHSIRGTILRVSPFATLAVAGATLTYLAQAEGQAVQTLQAVSIPERLHIATGAVLGYLQHFLHPHRLSVFYPRPDHVSTATTAIQLLLLSGVTVAAVAARRYAGPAVAIGWVLFLIMLVPVSGIIQVGEQASADRYMYGPILGILLAVCALVAETIRRIRTPWVRTTVLTSIALWTAAGAVSAHRQISFWSDTGTLASASLESVGPSPQLLTLKGTHMVRSGHYAEALDLYQQAIALAPTHLAAMQNSTVCFFALGDTASAIEMCQKLISMAPDHGDSWVNLALYQMHAGNHTEARAALIEAHARGNLSKSAGSLAEFVESMLSRPSQEPTTDKSTTADSDPTFR